VTQVVVFLFFTGMNASRCMQESQLIRGFKNEVMGSLGRSKSRLIRFLKVAIVSMSMVVTKAMVPEVVVGHVSYSDKPEIDGAIRNP